MFLKILRLSIINLFAALQGSFQDEQQINGLKMLILFLIYFIIFGMCLKALFDYLERGSL